MYLQSYQTKSYQTPPQHRSRVNLRLRDSQEIAWKRRGLRQSYLPVLHKYFALEILCVLGNADQNGPWHQAEEDKGAGKNNEKGLTLFKNFSIFKRFNTFKRVHIFKSSFTPLKLPVTTFCEENPGQGARIC